LLLLGAFRQLLLLHWHPRRHLYSCCCWLRNSRALHRALLPCGCFLATSTPYGGDLTYGRIPRCISLRGWVCFLQLTHFSTRRETTLLFLAMCRYPTSVSIGFKTFVWLMLTSTCSTPRELCLRMHCDVFDNLHTSCTCYDYCRFRASSPRVSELRG
jgi:hypothetical protein